LPRILAEFNFAPRANPLDENRVGKTVQAIGLRTLEKLLVAKGRKGNVHARGKMRIFATQFEFFVVNR
jgi:hypothetical protein